MVPVETEPPATPLTCQRSVLLTLPTAYPRNCWVVLRATLAVAGERPTVIVGAVMKKVTESVAVWKGVPAGGGALTSRVTVPWVYPGGAELL